MRRKDDYEADKETVLTYFNVETHINSVADAI